jgi:hypothetical protein
LSPVYESAESFRQALTDRLRREATRRGIPVETLRTKVFIERLLARLFHAPNMPWLLKGGYSFELRYRPRARTTRDIDLSMDATASESFVGRIARVRDELQRVAELDLGDHVVFRVEAARRELQGAPLGGVTFPIRASIAGKHCADFHIDIGFGDAMSGEIEELRGDDLLAFADIPAARALSISTAQQFAEKIHAYTFEWKDRENSRVKDLVDAVLLIERGNLDPELLVRAVRTTFAVRATHPVPAALRKPPNWWDGEFRALAQEAGIETPDPAAAFTRLEDFWSRLPLA